MRMKGSAFPALCVRRGGRAYATDLESLAGDRVQGRDVGAAVVCEDPLDAEPVTGEAGEPVAKEGDRGRGRFVRDHVADARRLWSSTAMCTNSQPASATGGGVRVAAAEVCRLPWTR